MVQLGVDEEGSVDFEALVERWLDSRSARGFISSPHTRSAYRSDLTQWARRLGAGALDELTVEMLTVDRIETALIGFANAGRSPATRQRYWASLRGFCRWATARGHLPVDPTAGDELAVASAPRRALPSHFTDREVAAIVTACAIPPSRAWTRWAPLDRALLAVLLGAGLRSSEVCALTDTDVAGTGVVVVRGGKGGGDRHIPVDREVSRRIDAYLEARSDLGVAGDSTKLFVDRAGKPLSTAMLASRIRSWLSQAGLAAPPGALAHAFRHTYAHLLVRSGLPLPSVQARLGHADLRTTSVYTRIAAEDTDQAGEVDIGAILRGHRPGSAHVR